MSKRVQVILDDEEREAFRQLATREGLSLSAWLRKAGQDRLTATSGRDRMETLEELQLFFQSCDADGTGSEPDWEQHKTVIEASRASGRASS